MSVYRRYPVKSQKKLIINNLFIVSFILFDQKLKDRILWSVGKWLLISRERILALCFQKSFSHNFLFINNILNK